MKLTVGLLRSGQGWEILLRQLGIAWRIISSDDELQPENFPVIIVNAPPTSLQLGSLHEYLKGGGSLLSVYGYALDVLNERGKRKYFSSLGPTFTLGSVQNEMIDIYSPGVVGVDKGEGTNSWFSVHEVGQGMAVFLPFDINALVLDTRSRRKNFYFHKKRLPSEIVSTVSKGNLRRLVFDVLQFLHRHRNLPFVHKWYYPNKQESLFTFRVDSDRGSVEEINELYQLCEKESIQTMWFVDTKSHERWIARFREFRNQEVGLHCYEHMTYATIGDNRENLALAASLLEKNGIHPKGASAPYGIWNDAIASVFEELGVSFSSEFGLDYDDLPFYPSRGKQFSGVLQLPIHPICIGSMSRSGYDGEEMKRYFRHVIDRNLLEREPICLYHHPTHRHWDVIEDMFGYIRSKGIVNLSYSQYAAWWRQRDAHLLSFDYDTGTGQLRSHATECDPSISWHIVFPSGEETTVNVAEIINLGSLPRRHAAPRPLPPIDIARTREFDFRHLLMNFLDSWYKRTQ